MKWAGHVANMGDKGNAYNIFFKETLRSLEIPRHSWVYNIKTDDKQIRCDNYGLDFM
jgi:hypothetical protein